MDKRMARAARQAGLPTIDSMLGLFNMGDHVSAGAPVSEDGGVLTHRKVDFQVSRAMYGENVCGLIDDTPAVIGPPYSCSECIRRTPWLQMYAQIEDMIAHSATYQVPPMMLGYLERMRDLMVRQKLV